MDRAPLLIVFGGLPGVGKTVLGRALALHLGAVYLRIDSIEQAMVQSDSFRQPLEDAGYRVAYFLAEDNLRLGRIVVADCVNPIAITRDSWVAIGKTAQAPIIEIEVLCSDPEEHCRRVEGRSSDIRAYVCQHGARFWHANTKLGSESISSLTRRAGPSSRASPNC